MSKNETFPRFMPTQVDDQATKEAFNTWNSLTPFLYDDSSKACTTCPFRKAHRDPKGNIYLGQWQDNDFKGRGTMIYATGDVYEGYWDAGLYTGMGRFISFDGNMYDGEWQNGKRNGMGVLKYSDGRQFAGNWLSGEKGEGIETHS